MLLDDLYKRLPIADRQRIFQSLKTEISETMMKYFLEKKLGYPSFQSCGFAENQIQTIWGKCYYEKICEINHIMEMNDCPPLFEDPSDSYKSAKVYFELI